MSNESQALRIILNGKCANEDTIRNAIGEARQQYTQTDIQVRVTWEQGDIARMITEAANTGVTRIAIGGGDGSLNEYTQALLSQEFKQPLELAVLPLGTANDFATACAIPKDFPAALRLAIQGFSHKIDVGKCNNRYFVNVASGGFGAQITAETAPELKNFLGGNAYTLTGLVRALNFTPYESHIVGDNFETTEPIIIGAICNGRQAGGGQQLAPNARINDGLFDVIFITAFPISSSAQVIKELFNPDASGTFVRRFRTQSLRCEFKSTEATPLNLDGEPLTASRFEFKIIPEAIRVVLPTHCPMLHG